MFKIAVLSALGATGTLASTMRIGDRDVTVVRMSCDSGLPAANRRQKCVDAAGNFLGCVNDGYHCLKKDIRYTHTQCLQTVPDSWDEERSRVVICDDDATQDDAEVGTTTSSIPEPEERGTVTTTTTSQATTTTSRATTTSEDTMILGGIELTLLPMQCDALARVGPRQRCVSSEGAFLGCVDGYHCIKKDIRNSYARCDTALPTNWGALRSRVVVCDDGSSAVAQPTEEDTTTVDDTTSEEDTTTVDDTNSEDDTTTVDDTTSEEETTEEETVPVPERRPDPPAPERRPDPPVPERSPEPPVTPAAPVKVHLDPGEGNRCLESDIFDADGSQKCLCAGPLWRCADTNDRVAKACDEGFQCVRKNRFYAICAEVGGARYQELKESCEWDLTIMPCGERTDKYSPETLLPRGVCPPP